jgi:BlaI family transcriptional regulator, penicillinase repressor
MSKPPSITEAEWHVMKVLWDREGDWLSAAEIVEPVAAGRKVHHRTVRTLLARLVRKGAVETRDAVTSAGATGGNAGSGGGGYLYRAKVVRDAAVRAESKSFLSRVFDGNAAPALVHLLHESRDQLSPRELQELRDLLNRKGKP